LPLCPCDAAGELAAGEPFLERVLADKKLFVIAAG